MRVPGQVFRSKWMSAGVAAALAVGLAVPANGLVQAAPVAPADASVSTLTVGLSPQSLVVDGTGTYGYAVTWQSHQVFKIRLSDFTIDDSMTLPEDPGGTPYPGGRAISLYGGNVYVTTSSALYQLNATTLPQAPDDSVAIPSFGQYIAIAWPYAYITHHANSDYVSKVDLTTMTVVTSIPSGGTYPMGISVDDSYAYVVNTVSSTLSRIRLSDFTVDGTLLIGQQPYGIAIDDSGTYAYVPTASAESWGVTNPPWLVRVDLSSFTVDDTVLLPFTWGFGVAVNSAGSTAYVTQSRGGNQVAKIALAPQMSLDGPTISVGPGPQAVAVNPTLPDFYTADFNDSNGTTLTKVAIGGPSPPNPTSLTPASGPLAGGTAVTIAGTSLTGGTVTVGGTAALVSSSTDTEIVFTTPAGAEGAAPVSVTTPGGTASAGTFTYVAPAVPTPASPPGKPRDVTAQASDRAAHVTWLPPNDSGSFGVSSYQVQATPGGGTCLTANLTCTVSGLVNGRAYTFAVRALTGAGWGAWSPASSAVTPQAAMLISGTRAGRRIVVTGRAQPGEVVQPWVKLDGQGAFVKTVEPVTAGQDGAFRWVRRAPREAWVYVTHGGGTSNTVDIPAAG